MEAKNNLTITLEGSEVDNFKKAISILEKEASDIIGFAGTKNMDEDLRKFILKLDEQVNHKK